MTIKMHTMDIDTINFINECIKYHNITGDIIPVRNTNGEITNNIIIIYNINSVDYNPQENIIKLLYKNIGLTIKIDIINTMFIDK